MVSSSGGIQDTATISLGVRLRNDDATRSNTNETKYRYQRTTNNPLSQLRIQARSFFLSQLLWVATNTTGDIDGRGIARTGM